MYIQHQNPGRAVALVAFSARVKQVILTPFTILEKIRRSYRGRGCDSRGTVFYCPNWIPAFVAVGEDWSMSPLRLQRFLITKHRRLRRCQWVKPPTRRSAFFETGQCLAGFGGRCCSCCSYCVKFEPKWRVSYCICLWSGFSSIIKHVYPLNGQIYGYVIL